jgi:hypothetical protein
MRFNQIVASGLTLLSSTVVAHPGHDITAELAERREFLSTRPEELRSATLSAEMPCWKQLGLRVSVLHNMLAREQVLTQL